MQTVDAFNVEGPFYLGRRADKPNEINLFEDSFIVGDPTAKSTAKLFLKA